MRRFKRFLHHLFVPNERNNFRAKALHHDFLSLYLVLAILLTLTSRQLQDANVLGFATDITVEKLHALTNKQRTEKSLPAVAYSERLAKAAQKKAEDMFAKNYWAHYAPDGKTPWNFMYEAGYQYEFAGENLAKNFLISDNVVQAWMDSPTHRDNILRSEYTEVGFAIANGVLNGEETTLVVQMFGKPLENSLAEAAPAVEAQAPVDNKATQPNQQNIQEIALGDRDHINASGFNFTLNMYWGFVIFLAGALVADLYFAARMNLVRFHGRNIPHMIFLLFMSLGFLLFLSKGSIL